MNDGMKYGIGLCVFGGMLLFLIRIIGVLFILFGVLVILFSLEDKPSTVIKHEEHTRWQPKRRSYQSQLDQFKAEAERKRKKMLERIKEAEFSAVETMTGLEFENWCALLLQKNGYEKVEVTPASGDHGVDVIAEKDGERYAFQCKRYKKPVGFSAVKEVYTGKALYKSDRAIIMTTSTFTDQARKDAKKLNVELWDRKVLLEMNHEGNKTSERIVAS